MEPGTVLRVLKLDEVESHLPRSFCAICKVNKHYHLRSVGHHFVPGDWPKYELMPWELIAGDVVAGVNSHTIIVSVYRRP